MLIRRSMLFSARSRYLRLISSSSSPPSSSVEIYPWILNIGVFSSWATLPRYCLRKHSASFSRAISRSLVSAQAVLADDEQRRERHHDEHPDRRAERDPPFDMLYNHTHGDDRRGEQGDPQRRALLCLDVYHRLTSCSFASAGRCICRRCRIRGSRPNRLRCGKNSCARRCRE